MPTLSSQPPLRDAAYTTLRSAILSGRLKPGEHLVERRVASQLGLSRNPVREAFRRLEQDQLVTASRHGVVVRGLNLAELQDLYLIRQDLEVMAARRAARNITPVQAPALQAMLTQMRAYLAANELRLAAAEGIKFHRALAQIAGNRRLALFIDSVEDEIARFWNLNLRLPVRSGAAWEEHAQLLAAILAHEDERAAQLMFEHVGRAETFVRQQAAGLEGRVEGEGGAAPPVLS